MPFFLAGPPPPPIQKGSPNQFLSTPSFGAQKRLFKVRLTFLGLPVRILQILNFSDIPGMSTSVIMPFHNVDPKLVHRLSQGQQIWPHEGSRTNICGLAQPLLEFDYPLPFKVYCAVPRSLCFVRKKLKCRLCPVSPSY